MFGKRQLAGIVATAGVAVIIGHVMQYGLPFSHEKRVQAMAEEIEASPPRPRPATLTAARKRPGILPGDPVVLANVLTASLAPVARRPVPDDPIRMPTGMAFADLNSFGIPCSTRLDAVPMPGGRVTLTLEASCSADERVEVSHEGLVFTLATSVLGRAEVVVPALRPEARYTVRLDGGGELSATANVPEADSYDRVALHWHGEGAMSIHAFEFGARQGDPGHVYRARGDEFAALAGLQTGEFLRLGDDRVDDPVIAEVYSFPTGAVDRSGIVRVNIEAEVTATNCGETIAANVTQTAGDGVRTVPVELAMPDCDAVGDILVLKNVIRDLKIASN